MGKGEPVKVGDTVRVTSRVKEGEKERTSLFEGVVIAIKGKEIGRTMTVRKIAKGGIGVERIYPLHSPKIVDIEVVREGHPRKSKLYYLRERKGRAATNVRKRRQQANT